MATLGTNSAFESVEGSHMTQGNEMTRYGSDKLTEEANALRALVESRSPGRLGQFESRGWRSAPQRFSSTNWGGDRTNGRTS